MRVTEGVPGQEVEVWIQDKGGTKPQLRGTVVIEDLRDVLTCISSRSGANGPQSPVTQYILKQAASHLAERLLDDAGPIRDGRESVPRTLSGSLGHQPFIESVLNMSQHQMLRRWPLANDWYQDVIHYVMRPSRFDTQTHIAFENLQAWSAGSMGDFLKRFAENAFDMHDDPKIVRMAEALQSLWPDYPPVRDAMIAYRQQVRDIWVPLYERALHHYGLTLRPGVELFDMAWAFNAVQSRETFERLADPAMPFHTAADGTRWTMTAWTGLMILAGSVVDEQGRILSLDELIARRPAQ
ncbi:hypothetical protein [Nigerium massiliense]|uniref:hypothetical protein n=1 Tax=Nigerium massiliense TaxID=1522317 RepID=UPI00058CE295|nr:hypothetical protein [Nigerium massiliense]